MIAHMLGGEGRLQWERMDVDSNEDAWLLRRRRRLQSCVAALAAVSLLVAAALLAQNGHADPDGGSERVEMSPQTWQQLKARAREGRLMPGVSHAPHAERVKEQRAEMHSAMSHLSSSSLVQRAATECANEAKCVPTVDELVKRAAAACSTDPSCVCDWGKYPRQCFLSEVQRHKQLEKDAKTLVRQINERAATDKVKKVVVSELEHEEESFQEVLRTGRNAVGSGDYGAAKAALAKAEYLHEVAVRKTGDANGPIMEEQERALKSFAREVVEAEAQHSQQSSSARRQSSQQPNRHGTPQRRGRQAGLSVIEQQIKSLSSNVEHLMHKVGSMEEKNKMKQQMTEAGVLHASSSSSSSNPKTEVENLVKEIGMLTGKLGTAEKTSERAGDAHTTRHEPAAVSRFGAEALAHEESQFTEAIARGERAAFSGKIHEAEMAVHEARYYHEEIVRLKAEPTTQPCLPCQQLQKTVERVKRNSGTTTTAHEPTAHAAARSARRSSESARLNGREQLLIQTSAKESPAALEAKFDAALSAGERERIRGHKTPALQDEVRAQEALEELREQHLPHGDTLVKREMRQALDSFSKGVRAMPHRLERARRDGESLAARVHAEEKTQTEAEASGKEGRKEKEDERQQHQGDKFVDHLLYGRTRKQREHKDAAGSKQRETEGAQQTHARARLERKARARAYTHTETDTSYASEMGSRRRKEELRGIALRDAREHRPRDLRSHAARRRLEEASRRLEERREGGGYVGVHRIDAARRRGGEDAPAELRPRRWQGRRGREKLPEYRKEEWEEAPLPKSMLQRIYRHYSHS